jgi:uncharacterized membrane protein YgcG
MKILVALLLPMLGGCIIYDTKPGRDCFGCVDGDTAGMVEGDTGAAQDPAPDATLAFALDPSVAEPGASFIGTLVVTQGDLDLASVTEVEVYGAAELLISEPREGQLLLGLSVSSAAEVGATVDLLLHLSDGSVALADDALTIVAPGTADDASGGSDGDADGGSSSGDGGSTGADGGSGSSGSDDCE